MSLQISYRKQNALILFHAVEMKSISATCQNTKQSNKLFLRPYAQRSNMHEHSTLQRTNAQCPTLDPNAQHHIQLPSAQCSNLLPPITTQCPNYHRPNVHPTNAQNSDVQIHNAQGSITKLPSIKELGLGVSSTQHINTNRELYSFLLTVHPNVYTIHKVSLFKLLTCYKNQIYLRR